MPKRKPILAGIIEQEILSLSKDEVRALNEFLDNTLDLIDQNDEKYQEYRGQILAVQEATEKLNAAWDKSRLKKAEANKVKKKIKKAKKTQSAVDKLNTIAAALNPVSAALQFAAKILVTELEFEFNALVAVEKIIEPSRDIFINFSGGFLSDGTDVRETADLPRKIRELEERMLARRQAIKDSKDALKERQQKRQDNFTKSMEDIQKWNLEAQEHNKNFDAQEAKEKADAEAAAAAALAEQNAMDASQQNNSESSTPVVVPNPDSSGEGEQTVYLEGTETGVPQGGLENAGANADQSANQDDTAGLSEEELEIFDAASNLNDDEFAEWLETEGLEE